MPRDPRAALVSAVKRSDHTVTRCAAQLKAARQAKARSIVAALEGGVTKVELAQVLRTSESRIRQLASEVA